uniref:Receptor-like serine/threonine-protein kinase n=1 Tax=Aegilops tauschii subsp. strangulata TaxID=200361 RepID=A0A452ZQ32_AEGTS
MASWFPPPSCSLLLHLLVVVALLVPSHGSSSNATDTITASRPLTGDQKLISQRGKFALGFFQPQAEGSGGRWYVGIWYNKIPVQTIVWVANREKPISDPASSSLTISDDGNIVLRQSKSVVWSSNSTNEAFNSTIAVLLDTGNLVVRHKSNSSHVVWQSFDDMTDTWLPDDRILSRHVIGVSGQTQSSVWVEAAQAWVVYFSQPKANCDVYGFCGAYSKCSGSALSSSCSCLKGFSERDPNSWNLGDPTAGCRRNVQLQCGSKGLEKEKQDRFYTINSVKLPDKAYTSIEGTSNQNCQSACLNNCSCTAYSYNGTCSLWYAELLNLQDTIDGSLDNIHIRVAASELPDSRTKKRWIAGVAVGGVATLGCAVIALYFLLRRRRRINSMNLGKGSLISFKYNDLQFLTKNFSEILGVGAFGSVFKGVLPDATIMAVKKLEGLRQGEKQFRAEVSTIGTIQHVNLIQLLGFCSEGTKRLLVYEYMPNGSLDHHLFRSSTAPLSWSTRYQIATGVARGLTYLHEECRDCIIHCDIKPENILLGESLVPKVADFGLAKLLGRDFSRVLTSMRGTIGYLAPEWISGEAITTKADVFSYGMMLFEIISGKRNNMHTGTSTYTFFPMWVVRKLVEGDVQTLIDSELVTDVDLRELERVCMVACWCVQDSESSRPTMGEIVQILEGLVRVEMPPVPRYLQVLAEGVKPSEVSNLS